MNRSQIAVAIVLLSVAFSGCFSPSTPLPPPVVPAANDTIQSPPTPKPKPPEAVPAITFEDLDIGMEPDSIYEPWMMKTTVKQYFGRRVRISGFISGGVFQLKDIRQFPLMREVECPYGPGGQAHHVIDVDMRAGEAVDFTTRPITLEGVLTLQPFTGPNGKTWSLYNLADGVVAK